MFDPNPIIRIQSVFMTLCGTFLYFGTEYALSFIIPVQTDGVHWHMARCSASFLIIIPIMFFVWTKSEDKAANSAALLCCVTFNLCALMATWYAKVYSKEYFYSKAMAILMVYFLVMTLLNVFLLLRSGWYVGRLEFEPDRQFVLNRLFMFDSFVAMVVGLMWMAYPELLLKKQIRFPLTTHHAYVCHLFGAILFATNVMATQTIYFKYAFDRLTALRARFMVNAFVLASQFHSQYASLQWWTHNHWVGMILWSVWIGIVALAMINVARGKWK